MIEAAKAGDFPLERGQELGKHLVQIIDRLAVGSGPALLQCLPALGAGLVLEAMAIFKDRDGDRLLSTWVGLCQANAIAHQSENVSMPRPMP